MIVYQNVNWLLLRLEVPGEHLSSPSGSGQSPAAKVCLSTVHRIFATTEWIQSRTKFFTTGVTTEQYRRAVRADVAIDFLCPPCESHVATLSHQPHSDDSWGAGLQHTPTVINSTGLTDDQASLPAIDVSAVTTYPRNTSADNLQSTEVSLLLDCQYGLFLEQLQFQYFGSSFYASLCGDPIWQSTKI